MKRKRKAAGVLISQQAYVKVNRNLTGIRYIASEGHCSPCDSLPHHGGGFCFNPRIQLRLAGLNGGFNFQLFRYKGSKVKITFEAGSSQKTIIGTICNVGTDFVDLNQAGGKTVTIMQERIVDIKWLHRCRPDHKSNGYHDSFEEVECCEEWEDCEE
ncbi:hypothetical protein [Paenibacillus tarimensis]|nr:hypothetical protein [Paenibacillus tarimensis]